MDNFTKSAKIEQFLRDEVMSKAVLEALQEAFLSRKGEKDVHTLAAERLAIDLLRNEGKRELEKWRSQTEGEKTVEKQIGL